MACVTDSAQQLLTSRHFWDLPNSSEVWVAGTKKRSLSLFRDFGRHKGQMLDMQTAQGASLTGHGELTTSVLLSACLTTASASGLNRRGDLRNVHCLEKQDPQKNVTRQHHATSEQCFLLHKTGASNVSQDPKCWRVFVLNMMVMVFWGFVCLFGLFVWVFLLLWIYVESIYTTSGSRMLLKVLYNHKF